MSIIKNVSAPYTINTINHDDPITLDSNVVIINGNLTVRGATTTVTSTDTAIYDNQITLNAGVTGTPILDAGIKVVRGTSANVDIRWNEAGRVWQVTNDGSIYYNVVATTTGNTRLVDDTSPQLGANLNTAGYAIKNNDSQNVYIDPSSSLRLDGNLEIKKFVYATNPSVISNYNLIVSSNVGTGGTGLYVTNDEGISNQELISKSRAVVYSIIF